MNKNPPAKFQNSLISDITPRTRGYKRREVVFMQREAVFVQRRGLNYGQFLDVALPSAPLTPFAPQPNQNPRGKASAHGLFHWGPKYIGGLIVAVVGLLFVIGSRASGSAQLSANTPAPYKQEAVKQEQVSFGLPTRLKIPKINVDAALDHVGLTSKGELGVPKGPSNAGWFVQGPRPGEKGSSVIDGHFGNKDHLAAVFDNLHKLQKGDNLYVEDVRGATIAFLVREFRTYGPNEDTSSVFGSSDQKAHLNLITCNGVWNKTQKSYSKRLVVFADKEVEP